MPLPSFIEDDVGGIIRVTVTDINGSSINISSATVMQFVFKKPDATSLTKNAIFTNGGTDGVIEYTTVSGDLNQVGTWVYEAHVEWGTNNKTSMSGRFNVYSRVV